MKIALAQMRVLPGDPAHNVATMKRYINEAAGQGCALVAFPEMCVGGYLLGDRWLDEKFCRGLISYNEEIRDLSGNIAILYGNIFIADGKPNKDGRVRKYNAGYGWYGGKPLPRAATSPLPEGIAIKTLLPNYRIFDDERYFFSLVNLSFDIGVPVEDMLQPFVLEFGGEKHRIGVEICEDIWFNDYFHNGRPLNVSRILIDNGADMIFNLSASPWTYGKDRARTNRLADAKRDIGRFVPFYYVNCVGTQNNGKNFVTFDGDSTVYDGNAEIVISAKESYAETLLVSDTKDRLPAKGPEVRDKAGSHFRAAVEGIRAIDELMGNSDFPYIIGLSGGVDSAVVACLTERAVGAHRLKLFNLPTRYNSDATKSAARHVAENLGVILETIPIEDMISANRSAIARYSPTGFNMENIQAKVRGSSILSNIAGILGGLMTCNGNKVEIALGYATLYGDVNGAVAPIGDLLKTEVFALAEYINEKIFNKTVIPSGILPGENYSFTIPPSAELKDAQRDPMKWGYHDALVRVFTDYRRVNPEEILEWYSGGELAARLEIPETLIGLYGLDDPKEFIDDLEWVVSSMQRSVFKRIQSPPVIIMSKGAFGYDLRESQLPVHYTRRYAELRGRIIAEKGDHS